MNNTRYTLTDLTNILTAENLYVITANVPPPSPVASNPDHPEADQWIAKETADQNKAAVTKMVEIIAMIAKARDEYTGTLVSESPFMEGLIAGINALYRGKLPRIDPSSTPTVEDKVKASRCVHKIQVARAKRIALTTYSQVTKEIDAMGGSDDPGTSRA